MAAKTEKSQLEEKVEQELDDILSSLGSEVTTIKLYRVEGGKQAALASYSPSELATNPEEIIGAEFGPGQYLVRVILPSAGKAGHRWGPSKLLNLASDSQYVQEWTKRHAHEPAPRGNSDNMERLFALMQDNNQKMHEMVIALISKGSSSSFDPTVAMTSMITGLASLKQMAGGNGDELDRVSKILEIAERVGGGSGPKGTVESILDAAKDLLPAIMAARGLQPPAEMQPAAETISLPASNTRMEPTGTVATAGTAVVPAFLQQEIRALWAKIEKAAQKDLDPEDFAGTLLDWEELEDQAATVIVDSILKSASLEDWEKVTGPIPEKLKPWFSRFYAALREGNSDPASPKVAIQVGASCPPSETGEKS